MSTSFRLTTAATSGPLSGDYLWNNAANWSNGVPTDGDTVSTAVVGYDNLTALTLASLILDSAGEVTVTGTLTVGTVAGTSGALLVAQGETGPATVTVGAITGTGGTYGAYSTGATFIDQSATDPGEFYDTLNGGTVELSATPAGTSTLAYNDTLGTFALKNPAATNAVLLARVVPGDVLELPGTSVSAVTFGASSLTVTTNDGSYAFTNVSYGAPVIGHTAAFDSATGLEAISFVGPDYFDQTAAATSGPLSGDYLWSNAANWSNGVPTDGDTVSTAVVGYDNLTALTLASLILDSAGEVTVTGTLTVGTVAGTSGALLVAQGETGPATVTVGAITGTGGTYGAYSTGATFIDQSATDPGEFYDTLNGGTVELSATPAGTSTLAYNDTLGTFALKDPAATNAVLLARVVPGDVLELPGTSVSAVTFGASSLTVTTNDGSYAFTNVSYGAPVIGHTAAFDSATGLEAISFVGPDYFDQTAAATSGPLSGDYLWSNAANWSNGVPTDGDTVSTAVAGYDNLAALTLASLILDSAGGAGDVVVTGTLTVGTVAGTSGALLVAEDETGPATVTVGAITGTGGTYGAYSTGATFIDQSATDPGEFYDTLNGGTVELSATPAGTSTLAYNDTLGTFALKNPAATNAVLLARVVPGDVLELPGTSVSAVIFGASSLTVTTNDGSYAFTNVSYGAPVIGHTAAFDSATGLEAISFVGPDYFDQTAAATSGPLSGDYLWSNAANWSNGVPTDGDTVSTAVVGYDNLTALTLASLILDSAGGADVTAASLNVTSVAGDGGQLEADASDAGAPVTVTVGTITGSGGFYEADGVGAIFVDNSSTDTDNTYIVSDGGTFELSAAPAASSLLNYDGGVGAFAFKNPAATNTVPIVGVVAGDVFELPGTSVSSVTFGTNSITVTTNDGTYAFNNVNQIGSPLTVGGYTAAHDATTGLEAITFRVILNQTLLQQINTPATGTNGFDLGSNGSSAPFGSSGAAGGDAPAVTDTVSGDSFFDPSASLYLAPSITGGNGGTGSSGVNGSYAPPLQFYTTTGILEIDYYGGGNGGDGGAGGVAGSAELDIDSDIVGSAADPLGGGSTINGQATGGNGAAGSGGARGGYGGYTLALYYPIGEQIEGAAGGNGGNGGAGSDGGAATASIAGVAETVTAASVIDLTATGGAGGQGGAANGGNEGGETSGGGTGGSGADGGLATASLTGSSITSFRSIAVTLTAMGGAGGAGGEGGFSGVGDDGGDQDAYDSETYIPFSAEVRNGPAGDGGDGGDGGAAIVDFTGNTLTAPNVALTFAALGGAAGAGGTGGTEYITATGQTTDSQGDTFSYFSAPPGGNGDDGNSTAGQINFTGNTITVTGTLSLTLHVEADIAGVESLIPLVGAGGGNLVFSANSFIGNGSSELDLQGTGSGVTVDDLHGTISIAGSPANAMTGFDDYVLGSGDTFIRGSSVPAVIYVAPDPDTIELLPGHGPTTLYGATAANTVLEFQGYGSALDSAAALQGDTVAEPDGNTAISIPGDGPVTLLESNWTPSALDTNLPGTGGGTPTLDTFSNGTAATTGPFAGDWLWTTSANWSAGLPISGDSVVDNGNFDVDEIPTLTLTSLTVNYGLAVAQADLTVATLVIAGGGLVVESGATMTIGGGSGGELDADGAGAVLNDLAPSDPGDDYYVGNYGTLIVAAPLATTRSDASELNYYNVGGSDTPGTFVLLDPGTTIDATGLDGISPGDVLELPGTEVQNVTFNNSDNGPNNGFLLVTTNAGSYDFESAGYGPGVAGYTAAVDPATGLVAITFTAGDAFDDNVAATSGPYSGYYTWSDASNWSSRIIPVNGADVYVYAAGYDDVAGLTLDTVGVTERAWLDVIANLTVGKLSLTALSQVYVDGTTTLTVQGPVSGIPGGLFSADNSGAVLVDNAPTDPGETYEVYSGGMVILAATPSPASVLEYYAPYPDGILALSNPGSTITTPLEGVGVQDVLELPGTVVTNVSASSTTLTVTTDSGLFYFTDVTYANAVTGYTQAVDPVTNLVAITFGTGGNVVEGAPTIAAGTSLTLTGSPGFAAGTMLTNDGLLTLNNADLTDDGVLANDGTLVLDPSTAVLSSLTGSGTMEVGVGSTLDVAEIDGTLDLQLGSGPDSLSAELGSNSVQLAGADLVGGAAFVALGAGAAATSIQGGANQPTSIMAGTGSDSLTVAQQGGVLDVQAPSASDTPLDLSISGGLANLDLGSGAASLSATQGGSTVGMFGLGTGGGAAFVALGAGAAAASIQGGGSQPTSIMAGAGSDSLTIAQQGGMLDVQAPSASDTPLDLSVFAGVANLDLGSGAASVSVAQGAGTVGLSGLDSVGGAAFVALGAGAALASTQGGGNQPTSIMLGTGADSVSVVLDNAPAIVQLGPAAALVTFGGTADPPQDIVYTGTGSETLAGGGSATADYVFTNGNNPTVLIEHFDVSTTSLALLNFPAGAATALLDSAVVSDGSIQATLPDGTQITFADVTSLAGLQTSTSVPCFAAGTRIATPKGDVAAEDLRPGDRVVSAFGGVVPLVWVGHRDVHCRRHPQPEQVWPVRIAAGAFAPGKPCRDLFLSPDHAVFVEDVLIPVKYLLNGASIAQAARDAVTYYHLEVPAHDVLLAEGLAAESYLNTGNRSTFENGGKPVVLHPDFALRTWDESACAPLLVSGPKLHAVRRRLVERLPELGHFVTTDPALCLLADGTKLHPQRRGTWLCATLPQRTSRLRLRSRHAVPIELEAGNDDTRRLGVAVQSLVFDGVDVALDDVRMIAGWHSRERDLRWTGGDASLDVDGVRVVELCLAPSLLRYHQRPAEAASLAA